MEEEYSGPCGWSELMVDIRQNNRSLVLVPIRQFLYNGYESGELPETMLIGDATVYWNKLPENLKTGVTAHIRIVSMSR